MAYPPPPPPSATSAAIIHPQYCAPHQVDLTITKERTLRDKFTVTDINGNVVFTVTSTLVTFVTPRQHRFFRDPYGNTFLHLQRSLFNDKWKAYRAESSEEMDLIFTRKRSSRLLSRSQHVFLSNNTTQVCDFKVKPINFGRSWVVYIGQSDISVAQIKQKVGLFSREKFIVTVSPNIDYAFIVALVATLAESDSS